MSVKAVLAGDYVLSAASIALAKLGNEEVVKVLSQVLDDLVAGMFCLPEHRSMLIVRE